MKIRSRVSPSTSLVFAVICAACLFIGPGCATASRVKLRDGERSAEVVLPKNYRATKLDLSLDPNGKLTLKADTFDANASKVIESTGAAAAGALSTAADAAKSLGK